MRDLYAVQFKLPATVDVERAVLLAAEWCSRATDSEVSAAQLQEPGSYDTTAGSSADVLRSDELWSVTLQAPNDADPTTLWRTSLTIGSGSGPIVTVRIGLGSAGAGGARVAPLTYEFGSPAIVRTLLREFQVADVGRPITPSASLVAASQIDEFVDFLLAPDRRLPVVLLSGDPATGRTPVASAGGGPADAELARELAGLAHVASLSSGYAGRLLTDAVGRERSVWHGAVRIYWPGFSLAADPYEHRLWFADRVNTMRRPLVAELRTWLATLSVARTPEHPGLAAARRSTAQSDADMLALFEAENVRLEEEARAFSAEIDRLTTDVGRLEAKLLALSYATARADTDSPDMTSGLARSAGSVAEALAIVAEEFADQLVVLDSARRSAREFDQYQDPAKALRALRAVGQAG